MMKRNLLTSIIGLSLLTVTALFLFNESPSSSSQTSASDSVRKAQKLMNLIKQTKQDTTVIEDKKAQPSIEKNDSAQQMLAPSVTTPVAATPTTVLTPNSLVLEKTQNFFAQIPRIHTLEGKTDADVHDVPTEVKEAGQHLANMREFFVSNPQPIVIETSFYLECTQQKDFFESIKAVCAARVGELYTKKTGRKISPLVFDKRTAVLKEKITL